MEAGKERLARDTVRDASRTEVDGLKRENERLKRLVADLSLDNNIAPFFIVFPVGFFL